VRAPGRVWTLAFSSDGRYLAAGCQTGVPGVPVTDKECYDVQLWEVPSLRPAATLAGHGNQVATVRFSPDGRRLATACYDSKTRVWDLATRSVTDTVTGATMSGAAFSPDGKEIATGGSDGTIRIARLGSAAKPRTFKAHEKWVLDLAYTPDGKWIVSAGSYDRSLRVWDAATGKPVRTFDGHPASLRRVAVSPDGKSVVGTTGGAGSTAGGSLHVWDLATGKEVARCVGHDTWVEDAAWTKDGRRLVSGGFEADRTVRLWDAATGKELKRYTHGTEGSPAVAVSPAGGWAASGGHDGTITLFPLPK
jgi:WD40 repeat protein